MIKVPHSWTNVIPKFPVDQFTQPSLELLYVNGLAQKDITLPKNNVNWLTLEDVYNNAWVTVNNDFGVTSVAICQ